MLGVDWTQAPEQAGASLGSLLDAQRYSGHLGFVAQGTPTNNTSESRAGFTTAEAEEAAALDPSARRAPPDEWSAGTRLAAALGLPRRRVRGPARGRAVASTPGLRRSSTPSGARPPATTSATSSTRWPRGDPQVDADLREFVRRNVFACGPLPTLRVARAALRRAARRLVAPVRARSGARGARPPGGDPHARHRLARDRERSAPAPRGGGPGRRFRPAGAAAAHARARGPSASARSPGRSSART